MSELNANSTTDLRGAKGFQLGNYNTLINNYYQKTVLEPRQLKTDSADFTGREIELSQLIAQLQRPNGERRIVAVSGMAGVGKSALIIHAAHQLQAKFSDVQLYVDLRGVDLRPRDPRDVLEGWLKAFGADRIPQDLTELINEYQTQIFGKRALVLLDNAQDENQIRPLLPGSSTCAVLVASRKKLVALEGTFFLDLDTMSEPEALILLGNKIGEQRVNTELEASKKIIGFCGRLPLAIQIAAGTLNKLSWKKKQLADYVDRLSNEQQRLSQLRLENLDLPDVRTSFNLSYQELDEKAACLFRWLSLLEGEDFGIDVTSILLETEPDIAELALEKLLNCQLIEILDNNRYRFHDLIRLFAQEKLVNIETSDSQDAAKKRIIQWYLEQTQQISALLKPLSRLQVASSKQATDNNHESLDEIVQKLEISALNWFEVERANLLSVMAWANQFNLWDIVASLADSSFDFFGSRNYITDYKKVNQWALEASHTTNNRLDEAKALRRLGDICTQEGEWGNGINCYLQSLNLCRAIGDLNQERLGLLKLGSLYFLKEDFEEAFNHFQSGLKISADEDKYAQSGAFYRLAAIYRRQEQWEEAINCCQKSLEGVRTVYDKSAEAKVLNLLGNIYRDQEQGDQAIEYHQRALEISRLRGATATEAAALHNIGTDYFCIGLLEEAINYLEQSLEISKTLYNQRPAERVLHDLEIAYFRQQQKHQTTEMEPCFAPPNLQHNNDPSKIAQQLYQRPKKSVLYQIGLLSVGTLAVFIIVNLSGGNLFVASAAVFAVLLVWFVFQTRKRR